MAPAIPSARRLLEDTHLRAILQDLHTLEGPSDAPPKPPDMIKFTTKTHVGEALKVCHPLLQLHSPPEALPRTSFHLSILFLFFFGFPSNLSYLSTPFLCSSLQTLAAYNILSAPVTDPSTQGYVGMLDVMDILGSFVGAVYPELLREGWMEVHKKLSVMELESLGVEFSARSIQGILHGGELWYKVSEGWGTELHAEVALFRLIVLSIPKIKFLHALVIVIQFWKAWLCRYGNLSPLMSHSVVILLLHSGCRATANPLCWMSLKQASALGCLRGCTPRATTCACTTALRCSTSSLASKPRMDRSLSGASPASCPRWTSSASWQQIWPPLLTKKRKQTPVQINSVARVRWPACMLHYRSWDWCMERQQW